MAKKRAKAPVKKRGTVKKKRESLKKRVTFAFEAPHAQTVLVAGAFCNWETESCALKKDKKGIWKKVVYLLPGRHEYRFLVDGQWQDDPRCTERVGNSFGSENCVLIVEE